MERQERHYTNAVHLSRLYRTTLYLLLLLFSFHLAPQFSQKSLFDLEEKHIKKNTLIEKAGFFLFFLFHLWHLCSISQQTEDDFKV